MRKMIEKLGLHLTVLLHKAGADDQAYEEILESLERAKKRTHSSKMLPIPTKTLEITNVRKFR